MLRALLQSVLRSLLIASIFIPTAVALPIAAFWLCLSPIGAMIVFWVGPWSCCFWALILHVMVGSRFWRGVWSVHAWRAERGGYVRSCAKSTMVMFGSLFVSYALEFAYVHLMTPTPAVRLFLPAVTYAPAAFTLWRAAHG